MLSLQDLKKRLKKPERTQAIKNAIEHELRLRFHSEMMLKRGYGHDLNRAVTAFMDSLDKILSGEKAALHKKMFRYPVETFPLVEEIRQDIDNIFDGQDPIFVYEFTDDETHQDGVRFLEELNVRKKLRAEGLENMLGRVNSICIVDAPTEQQGFNPRPYWYFQHISGVLDYELTKEDDLEWVIVKDHKVLDDGQVEYRIFVFDDESYRVFLMEDGTYTEIKSQELLNYHRLGWCPANFFWRDAISATDPSVKKSPISPYVSQLDKLQLSFLSKDVLDHTASNPIIWYFEGECDYSNPQTKKTCHKGFLRDASDNYIVTRDGLEKCPVCHESRFPGPGSYIGVDPPDEHSKVNLREPAGMIKVDVQSLNYSKDKVEKLRNDIFTGVTGNTLGTSVVIDKQAVNEMQVRSFFESRKRTYFSIKKNFEYIHSWIEKTICAIRYGERFKELTINYGTEFFLFSAEESLDMYLKGRENKLSAYILDMLDDQYAMTRYRHNKDQMLRIKIMNHLDPYRHVTYDELLNLLNYNHVLYDDFMLKLNLSSFVARFERENTSILNFGSQLDFKTKIEKIKETLLGYIVKPDPLPLEVAQTIESQEQIRVEDRINLNDG